MHASTKMTKIFAIIFKNVFVILSLAVIFVALFPTKAHAQNMACGSAYIDEPSRHCQCMVGISPYENGQVCCGWVFTNGEDYACASTNTDPFITGNDGGDLIITDGVTNATFNLLNPLEIGGGETIEENAASDFATDLSTPGGIVTRLLQFAFPIAGLLLFLMLVWGGFEILTGAATKKSVDAGKQRITAALLGFLLLFCTYWIGQLLEVVFGIVIL